MADDKPTQNDEQVAVPPPKGGRKTTDQAGNEQMAVPPPKGGSDGNKALKIILIVVGVIAVLGLLTFLAFGVFFKSAVDQVTDGIDVSNDGETVRISSGDDENSFEVSGDDKELPDDFPAQVKLIEPYTIDSSSKVKTGQRQSWTVNTWVDGQPNDNSDKITALYAADDGWEEMSQTQFDDVYRFSFSNEAEQLLATVSLNPDDDQPDKTYASYTVIYDPEQQ